MVHKRASLNLFQDKPKGTPWACQRQIAITRSLYDDAPVIMGSIVNVHMVNEQGESKCQLRLQLK